MNAAPSKLMAALSATGWEVLGTILDATPSIAAIADAEGSVILRASRFGGDLSGWNVSEIEGLTTAQYVAKIEPSDIEGRPLAEHEIPLVRAMNGERVIGFEGYFSHKNGERIPVVVNAAPFHSLDGEVIGAINSATDMRKFKAVEAQLRSAIDARAVLYEELAHRVKNHLQIVSSLIAMEARHARTTMERMVERLAIRTKGLAAIYDRIHEAESGGQVVARQFMEEVVRPYRTDAIDVVVTAPEQLTLSHTMAAPFGMLLNEAVCNSFKHAFPSGFGRIDVAINAKAPGQIELDIFDNGVGFADRPAGGLSHGMKLMQVQAEQLGAEMSLSNRKDGGARLVVVMPVDHSPLHAQTDGTR